MKRILLLLIAIVSCTHISYAEVCDTNSTRTQERLSKLEGVLSKLPKISGSAFFRYQYDDAELNSFDIRRVRLSFAGNLSAKFEYKLQLELTSSPKILDVFMKWKLNPMFNVQVGQYKLPFSLENPIAPTELESIDAPMFFSKYSPFGMRDIGIAIYGGFFPQKKGYNIVDYNVAVINGAGMNVKDDNGAKNFVGKLNVHPTKGLTLSGSFYEGKKGEIHSSVNNRLKCYSTGIEYKAGKWNCRSEFFRGNTQGVKYQSVYALATYFITPKFYPLLRYDYYDGNINVGGFKERNYTIGGTYWPAKYVGIQANYTYQSHYMENINLCSVQCIVKF